MLLVEQTFAGAAALGDDYSLIDDGRTGVIVDDYKDMAGVLERAAALDPMECRRYVEERFSFERMVRDYEAAYEKELEGAATAA